MTLWKRVCYLRADGSKGYIALDWRVLIIIGCDDALIIGRRGTKRKAEEAEEQPMKQKEDKRSGEEPQEGLKVLIEHW